MTFVKLENSFGGPFPFFEDFIENLIKNSEFEFVLLTARDNIGLDFSSYDHDFHIGLGIIDKEKSTHVDIIYYGMIDGYDYFNPLYWNRFLESEEYKKWEEKLNDINK